jgi:peptidoglycan hydrolase CwlO-like protein
VSDDSDLEDMSYVIGRMYERIKDKDDDPIRELARAIKHLYRKIDELEEKIVALNDRIDEVETNASA